MTDSSSFNSAFEGKSPLELGKSTIDELFAEYKDSLSDLTFISTCGIKCELNEYYLPKQNRFFFQIWNKTFMVEVKKNKINVSLKANFIVKEVKECTLVYNDKSGKKPLKYYVVTLINSNGKIEKDVVIANNSKSDYKQFQADINSRYNNFVVNMTESEFKTFVAEFISPKIAINVINYQNAGVIKVGEFLCENALATKDGIIWADDDGYIKLSDNEYIKLAEATHYPPKLAKSMRTGKEILKSLLENIVECWSDDIVLPMMTLGHMVMSIYYEEFIKRYGAPGLILFGETGTGKSTLVTVGLSIFGLSREALTSGGSSAKSNEYFGSKYNGMNICIDDVKGETLVSSNFTALVKGAYKGIPRTRMLPYGRGVEYINTCSPMAYSTNETLPDLREVVNRLNIVEIFGKVFKADKFKYHEVDKGDNTNLKELSLILPEFLKYSIEDVMEIYETTFTILENSNLQDTQKRVINNLAYAYTGIMLMLDISGMQIDGLDEKIIEFAKKQVKKYEDIKNIVDKVLLEISTLHELEIIQKDSHFKVGAENNADGKSELCIRFNKDVILSIINKYYAHDKSKRINEELFKSYAKNHPRYRGTTTSRLLNAEDIKKPSNAMIFCIDGLEEYANFGSMPTPMSAQQLADSIKGNSM